MMPHLLKFLPTPHSAKQVTKSLTMGLWRIFHIHTIALFPSWCLYGTNSRVLLVLYSRIQFEETQFRDQSCLFLVFVNIQHRKSFMNFLHFLLYYKSSVEHFSQR
jgi:hypothetical protein